MKRAQRENDGLLAAAWANAKLTVYAPAKAREFVKLEKLLAPVKAEPSRRQTIEQQIAIARQWTAATAGR